jgi:hypothetical protein
MTVMTPFSNEEIDKFITETRSKKIASDLGFFSKPFRVRKADKEFVLKLYLPVKDFSFVSSVIRNHNEYINELKFAGISLPETTIVSRQTGKRHQLVIIQEAFREDELLRNIVKEAAFPELVRLCNQIFDDIIKFWRGKKDSLDIGFHPTLRNYSLHDGILYYFDTFPPMLMDQKKLNMLIIKMSPFGGLFRILVPAQIINRVSDEYYNLDKMFTGVVGSCCRLRPDDAEKILAFSCEYVEKSTAITGTEKESISALLHRAPELPGIWIFFRKLSGNIGNPNIRRPAVKK